MREQATNLVEYIYRKLIAREERESQFWILASFLPTFIIARFMVQWFPEFFVKVRGVHIHHFAWGIIILAISGFLSIMIRTRKYRDYIAALYGIGLALAFDEFGMWVQLEDRYWDRTAYDAILIIIFLLINAVYFSRFWEKNLRRAFKKVAD